MEKKKLILTGVAIMTLIGVVLGAAYAYFVAQTGAGQSANINVTANTTDSLMFEVDNDLNINITQENFAEGMENAHGTLQGRATLLANDKTNEAIANYYVYLDITENSFIYTTEERTPEILLKVTTPTGEELTNFLGLDYVTVKETSGFDITERVDLINLSGLYTIEAKSKKTDNWQIEIIVINLDSNQNANTGKNLNAKLILGTEKKEVSVRTSLADVCTSGDNLADCIKSLQETSYYAKSKLLKHDSNLTNGAEDNSIRYTGGDENYKILNHYDVFLDPKIFGAESYPDTGTNIYYFSDDTLVAENIPKYIEIVNKFNIFGQGSLTEEDLNINNRISALIGTEIQQTKISNDVYYYISNTYASTIDITSLMDTDFDRKTVLYDGGMYIYYYLNDEIASQNIRKLKSILDKNFNDLGLTVEEEKYLMAAINGGIDNLFLMRNDAMNDAIEKDKVGKIVSNQINNYICFGMEGTTCDEDHLYRIIGVFDDDKNGEYNVKLIKNKSLGDIAFDSSNSNVWQTSTINNNILNGVYLTELGSYAEMIRETAWNIGGYNTNGTISKTFYIAEKANQSNQSKIGLMYVSDYGYAAYQGAWTGDVVNYQSINVITKNWLFERDGKITITPSLYSSNEVFVVDNFGRVRTDSVNRTFSIYPVLYLNSNMVLKGGNGTPSSPYIIGE